MWLNSKEPNLLNMVSIFYDGVQSSHLIFISHNQGCFININNKTFIQIDIQVQVHVYTVSKNLELSLYYVVHFSHKPHVCNAHVNIYLWCLWQNLGSGRGAMGRALVFQLKGLVFDSQWITVVSGRASDLKCSCATLVQVRRPVLILEIKNRTSRFLTEYHRVSRL